MCYICHFTIHVTDSPVSILNLGLKLKNGNEIGNQNHPKSDRNQLSLLTISCQTMPIELINCNKALLIYGLFGLSQRFILYIVKAVSE